MCCFPHLPCPQDEHTEVAAGNEPWRSWKPLIWLKTSLQVHDKPFSLKVLNLSRFFPKRQRGVAGAAASFEPWGSDCEQIPGVNGEFLPLFLQVAMEMKAILFPTLLTGSTSVSTNTVYFAIGGSVSLMIKAQDTC